MTWIKAAASGFDYALPMDHQLLQALQARRAEIRFRWEVLLRAERLHTPLANPCTLIFLFDSTLDEVFAALAGRPARKIGPRPTSAFKTNPFRDYFTALEQALLEALIHTQAGLSSLCPSAAAGRAADLRELQATLRHIALREIRVFDRVCARGAPRPSWCTLGHQSPRRRRAIGDPARALTRPA